VNRLLLLFSPVVIMSQALAHPGHGAGSPDSVTHHATSPQHSVFWMIAVLCGMMIVRSRMSTRRAAPE